MFCQMVRKEVLESLMDVRFVLSILITVTLFAVSTLVSMGRYREQSEDYWHRVNEDMSSFRGEADQLYELAFYEQHIYRRPKMLALCAGGSEESLPGLFTLDGFEVHLPQVTGQSNFALPRFNDLDWAFIISLVLSFTALVFSYNCICGERERGTLRLILAGSVPRATILLAKYVGLMLTLGAALLLGLLAGLVILVASGTESLSLAPWTRLIGIALVSFLYLSIFVSLGMFASARASRSSNSVVALLLTWTVLLVIVPSVGRVISNEFYRAPTPQEFERAKSEAGQAIDDRMLSGAYGDHAGNTGPNRDDPSVNPTARARYCNAFTESVNRVVDAQHVRMLAQAEAGRYFTYVSPAVVYRRICEVLAGTGIDRCRSLYQQVRTYRQTLREYILQEDRDDPNSLHLLFEDRQRVVDWTAISAKPVAFDTVPKCQERDVAMSESLGLVIWDIGLLVLFNLFFFAASFVSFLRYDVR